jgi:hypothetical protein
MRPSSFFYICAYAFELGAFISREIAHTVERIGLG